MRVVVHEAWSFTHRRDVEAMLATLIHVLFSTWQVPGYCSSASWAAFVSDGVDHLVTCSGDDRRPA